VDNNLSARHACTEAEGETTGGDEEFFLHLCFLLAYSLGIGRQFAQRSCGLWRMNFSDRMLPPPSLSGSR
jgi:hypothetical protein